jgi:hypothetical protein
MRPKYLILNNQELLGRVYEVSGRTIIFMNNPNVSIEDGMKFYNMEGIRIEDKEVEDLLINFIFKKALTNS